MTTTNHGLLVQSASDGDRPWISDVLRNCWGSQRIVSRGTIIQADTLPALVVWSEGERIALLAYRIADRECEIVTLNSLRERCGAGSALLATVRTIARQAGCRRIALVTTNDNFAALRFYQKRGFVLVAFRRDAIRQSRALKPEIPLLGCEGIPIRDELELEWLV